MLQILDGPGVRAAPARSSRPGQRAAADRDQTDARTLTADEPHGAGRARAHRDSLEGDALEVDLDGRETVLTVEETRRREPGLRSQRLDESVQSRAHHADQPLGLVQFLVRLAHHARARGAADARARRRHGVERPLVLLDRALVLALGDCLGERGQRLGHPAPARDQQLAAVGDVAAGVRCASDAAAQAHEREHEHGGAHCHERPHQCARAAPRRRGGCGRKGGCRKGGGGDRAGARGAGPGGTWDRPLAGHHPSVGVRTGEPVLRVRDLNDGIRVQFLIIETLIFYTAATLMNWRTAHACWPHEHKEQHAE